MGQADLTQTPAWLDEHPTACIRDAPNPAISLPAELGWQDIRARATGALEAGLARLAREKPHEMLSAEPQPLPSDGGDLEVWASRSCIWTNQRFFAVDADLELHRPENRHVLRLKQSRGRRLRFGVPEDTHTALGDGRRVRVVCVSDLEIRLKQALLRALLTSHRGDLVEQLWNLARPALPLGYERQATRPLNREQLLALSAMTSEGASFVWGPPGTGKTTTIIEAVIDALAHDRTVLIASHTHAAVDNVLEGLLDTSLAEEPWSKPGVVIRVASTKTLEKVSPAIREHRFLMRDAAAANLTNQAERQADISKRREENRTHSARQQLQEIVEDLESVDAKLIKGAQVATGMYQEMTRLELAIATRNLRLTELDDQLAKHRNAADIRIDRESGDVGTRILGAESQMRWSRHRLPLGNRLKQAGAPPDRGISRALALLEARRHRRMSKPGSGRGQAGGRLSRPEEPRQRSVQVRGARLSSHHTWERVTQERRVSQAISERELRAAAEVEREQNGLRSIQATDTARLAHLRTTTAAVTLACATEVLQDARREGVLEKVERREQLNEQVAELDAQAEAIDCEQASLSEEITQRRATLLAQAPVVACTVAALASTPALLARRFDVVILDEVASIEPAYVALAGSKADRTLALVGDFLQNAPVAETDDIEDRDDREMTDWQRRDFFYLAGIHDRASAERHPRCVMLRAQHRFPRIIAEAVNAFCYDGLLQSAGAHDSVTEPTITLIDTSRHTDGNLQPDEGSWWYQLGLDLLVAIAYGCAERTDSIGFVCPYRPQAHRAQRLSRRDGLPVQCGTAHTLQGREFHTVIVDLMQDGQPRWAGVANLHGSERDKAAARLLNVALTRARTKLYLIGDWDFIRHYNSPGMWSLANLENHPSFEVVEAGCYLDSSRCSAVALGYSNRTAPPL
jgi:AAA domain